MLNLNASCMVGRYVQLVRNNSLYTSRYICIVLLPSGVPRHISTEQVKAELQNIPNVKHAHNIHVWSLTMNKVAIAAHLAVGERVLTYICQ